jgi:tyrosine-specific transport protein
MVIKFNRRFLSTALTLSGTIIGAGILGLPYVFAQAGFIFGLFWLIFLGSIVLVSFLYLGEVSLRTNGKHQLTSLAKRYLGKKGEIIMFFAVMFGIYSSLLAYLIGEGESLSQLFFGNINYALYFTLGFWFILTFLVHYTLKDLRKIETYGVFAIILIIFVMLFLFLPKIQVTNLIQTNYSNIFLPFGVILFALLGFTSIPDLRQEIKGHEKRLKKAIILGLMIPIFLYLIFVVISLGVFGKSISPIATVSLGVLPLILGIFSMLTSYYVLSFALKGVYRGDLKLSKKLTFVLMGFVPLILFFLVFFFKTFNFIQILGIGGVISGGLVGILILLMNFKAKKKGNRKPEYVVPINIGIIILFSLIFLFGIFSQLFL